MFKYASFAKKDPQKNSNYKTVLIIKEKQDLLIFFQGKLM